jgi:hypothetical protein
MAAQEVLRARAHEEAHEDRARPAQHDHEGQELALRPSHLDRAEVTPIHLPLFARQRAQAQVRLRLRARPVARHHVPEVIGAAAIAAFATHVEEPARRQPRPAPQRVEDERQVVVQLRGPRRSRPGHAVVREHAIDHVVVHAELARDRPALPLLHVVEPQDLRREGRIDHRKFLLRTRDRGRDQRSSPKNRRRANSPHGRLQKAQTGGVVAFDASTFERTSIADPCASTGVSSGP